MISVLKNKLCNLIRGEEGAALIVTLALFMLLYIACAGVFAIGSVLKTKIVLQNACDAAAYSAAVVRAETLDQMYQLEEEYSRLYREMLDQTKDYITYQWLTNTVGLCRRDELDSDDGKIYSDLDDATTVECVRLSPAEESVSISDIEDKISTYVGNGIDEVLDKLESTRLDLIAFTNKYDTLIKESAQQEKAIVEAVLKANLSDSLYGDNCLFTVSIQNDWLADIDTNDTSIISHMTEDYLMDDWFELDSTKNGIRHAFKIPKDHDAPQLSSHWAWREKETHLPHTRDLKLKTVYEELSAKERSYFGGGIAFPKKLSDDYFGKGESGIRVGAISVGIAKKLENPWLGYLKAETNGFYEVFTPAVKWMWVVSSAQALRENNETNSAFGDTKTWQAKFVPVKECFTKNGFADWICSMSDSIWPSADSSKSDYSENALDVDAPQLMHGSGDRLNWGEVMNLLFH